MQAPAGSHWLDADETIAAEDLSRACRITIEELHEIASYGAPAPLREVRDVHALSFTADWLVPLRRAVALRRDYDLDLFAVSLLAEHLRRIEELEAELRALRASTVRG